MGSRNLDRQPLFAWADKCRTVGQMQAAGWRVFTKCQKCELIMAADLALIAKVSGPETVLWNRRAECRRLGCGGRVRFMAMHPVRNGAMEPLDAPSTPLETWGQSRSRGKP